MAHPRLQRRDSGWVCRAKVPLHLRPVIGKTEIVRSLHAATHKQAVERLRAVSVEIDRLFRDAESKLQAPSLSPILHPVARIATEEDVRRVVAEWFRQQEREAIADEQAAGPVDDLPAILADLDFDEGIFADAHDPNTAAASYDVATRILARHHLTADEHSPQFKLALHLCQRAIVERLRQRRARLLGDLRGIVSDPAFAGDAPARPASPLVSTLAAKFADERKSTWSAKTKTKYDAALKLFVAVIGDRPIATVTKEHLRDLKDTLIKLPANYTKMPALRRLSPCDAAAKAVEKGLPPQAGRTTNQTLGNVVAFFAWAEDNNYLTVNPIGRGIKVKIGTRAMDEWQPFGADHLKRIFAAPLYTGCKSLVHWMQPGTVIPRSSARYWLPVLAVYSGARLGELAQLAVADVIDDGIPALNITDVGEGQSVKTRGSRRVVPLHPALIDFGFLHHVAAMRERGEQKVFPDAKIGSDGYASSRFSKWFGRFLDHAGVKGSRLSFHSFRHAMKDAMRAANIDDAIQKIILGHVDQSMSGRYGSGYPLAVLRDAIAKVQYPLDLRHLLPRD